jgi:hypothetical protein
MERTDAQLTDNKILNFRKNEIILNRLENVFNFFIE